MRQRPSIAIVGAGPAGLTAANVFHRYGWQCQVFESDTSATSRDQGGSLDLHPEDGQLALEKAGLLDQFMAVARHEDQGERIIDGATGAVMRDFSPAPGLGERPEIDRDVLRQILLEPLGRDIVHWNSRIRTVDIHPDGRVALYLEDGFAGLFDLVIGADGAWSRVRNALTDVFPRYTGITFVELWIKDVDETNPAAAELVGHGTMFALRDQAGIIGQRNGKGMLRIYAAFRNRPEDSDRPDKNLVNIDKKELLSRFPGWATSLTALLQDADQIAAIRPIMTLPAEYRWPHHPGLTLVGDAAHVMPPLGSGVNLAMLDAAELAENLINASDWRQAVKTSEQAMLDRSSAIASQCIESFDIMFSQDGAQSGIENFDAHRTSLSEVYEVNPADRGVT
jgi:2-polyprenyl-6-methoxyphenol hydroxylase-like FAD-dependent oxidoreductase